MRIQLLLWFVLLALLLQTARPARAADPQPYKVTIAATGDKSLDDALSDGSQLASLAKKAPVGPFPLITRAKGDVERVKKILEGFGYYQSRIAISIDGVPADDPSLVDRLNAVPAGTSVEVKIAIEKGPLFHLGEITLDGDVPPDAREKLGLMSGHPAVASDVLAAGAKLLTALQEDGYALAEVDPPIAILDPARQTLDITFKARPGRIARIGAIDLVDLQSVNREFVERRLMLHSGDLFQPSKIEAARQDLASIGVFSGVSARAGTEIAPDGTIPITFDFQERPLHAVGASIAYSTDLGGSLKATWSDRNLFGNAEQLNLSAGTTGLGGTAQKGLGYNLQAQLIEPDFLIRDQSLEYDLGALKQDLQAYNQRAVTAAVALHRKITKELTGSVGISAEQEQIVQEGITRDYTLVGLPITLAYDATGLTDPLQDPTHGFRAAVTVTPTESLGRRNASFFILQISGSIYFDLAELGLTDPGKSVVALRGLIGSVQGASQFQLPPDQRFYGGGSATVRGFKYQSIGPLFRDHNPIGGTAIDAATIELRQRLFGDFGAAAFIDAGQVSAGSAPFGGTLRTGAGIGARYYSPIGVVRADFAVPLNRPPGDDSFEFYIGLGQAF
ncbi:MAG TPA: BamA/TamA family outer membrane protein [Alphaproteobacteria bacterium]|nr:BamA/TamA family outer membrane protein [Alphaproteobacteria bacterium]